MTGVDEEALSKIRDQVDFYDAVLNQGTVRIGDIDLAPLSTGEKQSYLQQLLIGERDQVFLAIVQA
ncbi:hypothetical protein, partial [Salmonella sp. SAL4434]|uniref:hypothetical protein n=1 Tax=Salmonella sp. SAL4434 TaxID=3159889 RepID=UPI00397E5F98